MQGIDTLAAHVELRQVLWVSVGNCPLVVLWLEGWGFLLTFFLLGWWLFFSLFLSLCWNWFGLNRWWLWEFFIDNLIFSDELSLGFELKSNNGSNFSDDSLNIEKLIHEPELKLVVELGEFP